MTDNKFILRSPHNGKPVIPFIIFFLVSVISGTITIMFWTQSPLLGCFIKNNELMMFCALLKPMAFITSSMFLYRIKKDNILIWIFKGLVIGLAVTDAILLLVFLLIYIILINDTGSWGVGPT